VQAPVDIRNHLITTGYEEGVVSLKALSNGLVAIIYTDGTFRVWSLHTGSFIVEYNVLDQIGDDQPELTKRNLTKKVVSAKITYLTKSNKIEDESLTK
jgi:hypothetical protein